VEVIGGSSVAECVASKHSSAQVKPGEQLILFVSTAQHFPVMIVLS